MQNLSGNTTSVTDYQTKQIQSLYLLKVTNEVSSQLMVALGALAVLCAIFNISTILSSKVMRTKTYMSIFGVSIGNVIYNITYIKLGITRLVLDIQKHPQIISQLQCMLEDCSRVFTPVSSKGFYCLCAIDRFIAVYKPHWYKTSYPWWLFPLLVILNLCNAFLDVGIAFYGTSDKILIPLCAYTFATPVDYLSFISNKNLIFLAVTILSNLATMITVYVRLRNVRMAGGNVKQAKKELQTKALWSLAAMLVAYLITVLLSTVLSKIYAYPALEPQLRLAPLYNVLGQMTPVCDFAIFMWLNKDYRKAFLKLFHCCNLFSKYSTNTVVDLTTRGQSLSHR